MSHKRRSTDNGGLRGHVQRFVPFYVSLMVTIAAAAALFTYANGNRDAIERSCGVLNAAIIEAQSSQGNEATKILIGAILEGKPDAAEAYRRAVAKEPQALREVDCARVVEDPDYQPYK